MLLIICGQKNTLFENDFMMQCMLRTDDHFVFLVPLYNFPRMHCSAGMLLRLCSIVYFIPNKYNLVINEREKYIESKSEREKKKFLNSNA